MLNEYKDKIELQKEVLAALPRNNNKNNKLYKAKVEEMLKEYQVDKEVVEEEITKRRNRYLSLEYDKNIDNITNKINELLPQLPLLNKYNSSYEKSNLDIILYELGHFQYISSKSFFNISSFTSFESMIILSCNNLE